MKPKDILGEVDYQTMCVRFDPKDKYIAAGCSDGTIKIFNVLTGKPSYTLNTGMESSFPMTSIKWRPLEGPGITKNVLISANASGIISHWHTTSGKELNRIEEKGNQILGIDYSPDGTMFASCGKDTVVWVYDEMEREEPIMNLTGSATGKPGHSSNVTCVKFNRQDKNILISGGWDNTIQVWDLRTGDTVRSIYGPYIAGDALDIIDDLILSGQYRQENQLQIWDL